MDFRDVVVLLGRFPALAGATANVCEGEVVLLRGPNGVGKTTFLRTCAGLNAITSGSAEVLGHDLTADRNNVRRHVGLLGHRTHLYDELTVGDNVRFWASTLGIAESDAMAAADRVGLTGRLLDVEVQRLSAGQRRRTALAVVVARRPRLWLLDEPHAGLDHEGRDNLDELLRQAADAGATIVFASHELDRAESVADRVLEFSGGRIERDDP
ncbi:MAG: heme ABC exporter ATP-binding protein CcmA [Actinomycetia bacterium]|nr:heme ABC exporter ATP-binding protein CcmA [Actinomycetes bacterium]MCP4960734.1 heme ABC exporter ATP-binding protein CcmA [Actinomycetes bacterium]